MFRVWLVKIAKMAASSGPKPLFGRHEEQHREGEIAEDWNVEQRNQDHLRAAALGRESGVGKGEDQ